MMQRPLVPTADGSMRPATRYQAGSTPDTCQAHDPLIPSALEIDRFSPVSGGDRSDLAWDGAEAVPSVAAGGDDRLVAVEDAGVEEVVLEELPQILDRVQF